MKEEDTQHTPPTETKPISEQPAPEKPQELSQPTLDTPKDPPQSPARTRKLMIIIASLLAGCLLITAGVAAGLYTAQYFSPNDSPSLITGVDGNTTVTAEETSIAAVAEKVGPSVVSIVTETQTTSYFGSVESGAAAGTGVFVSADGYVMTNNHVVASAQNISVIDSEGNVYDDVEMLGRDPLNDIAFLKVTSDKTFTPVELGNSATIRTGQQVVAIGNALGQYSNTVTSGIISGTGRPITASSESGATESLTDLIQTDASINHGNSGGPLVNMAGQVIGINTAIAEDANGIGFAIPINATKGTLAGVLEDGTVSRSFLGVNYITITPAVMQEYNLDVANGAYVYVGGGGNPVASGGPADEAGLERGDIIIKVNDDVVGEAGGLSSILGEYRPGDKITLTYLRDGKEQTTTLNLDTYEP